MYQVSCVIWFKKKTTFWPVVPIDSRNHIHLYPKVLLTCPEQKIGNMYSLINLGSLIYGEYEYNKTIMEGIGQDLGSKNDFVSLTRVSQRPVNDCRDICQQYLSVAWGLVTNVLRNVANSEIHRVCRLATEMRQLCLVGRNNDRDNSCAWSMCFEGCLLKLFVYQWDYSVSRI